MLSFKTHTVRTEQAVNRNFSFYIYNDWSEKINIMWPVLQLLVIYTEDTPVLSVIPGTQVPPSAGRVTYSDLTSLLQHIHLSTLMRRMSEK